MVDVDQEWRDVPPHWRNKRIHFFKYMPASTAKIVLENRTLRWSTSQLLNDAWEMNFEVLDELDADIFKEKYLNRLWQIFNSKEKVVPRNLFCVLFQEIREKIPELTKDELFFEFGQALDEALEHGRSIEKEVTDQLKKMLEKVKVLCLTTRPDNDLMWAHYAQGHTGVVLRFKSSPIIDSVFGVAEPVQYQERAPVLYSEDDLIEVLCGLKNLSAEECFRKIVSTKSHAWAYEEEWRLNGGDGRNPEADFEDGPFSPYELDGVIFGAKCSALERIELRRLCGKYPFVRFFNAVLSGRDFRLSIHEIE